MLPDSVVLCVAVEWSQIRRCVFIHPFHCHLLSVSLFLNCLLLFLGYQHKGWEVLSPPPASEWCKSLTESLVWGVSLHPENILIPGIFCVLNNAQISYSLHTRNHFSFHPHSCTTSGITWLHLTRVARDWVWVCRFQTEVVMGNKRPLSVLQSEFNSW